MAGTYPKGFYVYQLVDPRTGLPFYVGKGQRDRAWQHQRDVEAGRPGKNERKVQRIREILQSGADVEVTIVAQYELESDALDHEYRLVDAMPTLTNIHPGGGGGVSTPLLIEKRRREREERLRVLREKERAEAEARALAERKKAMLSIPGAELYQGEIEGWLHELEIERARTGAKLPPTGALPWARKEEPPRKKQPQPPQQAPRREGPFGGAVKVSPCGGIYGNRRNKQPGRRIGT